MHTSWCSWIIRSLSVGTQVPVGLGREAPALNPLHRACLLVKQLVTWGTGRPGWDHRAVWTEPHPERWNPVLLPGFSVLQSILGPTRASPNLGTLQPSTLMTPKNRHVVHVKRMAVRNSHKPNHDISASVAFGSDVYLKSGA